MTANEQDSRVASCCPRVLFRRRQFYFLLLNEHALNKIVRTHTLLRVLIARLERLGGV